LNNIALEFIIRLVYFYFLAAASCIPPLLGSTQEFSSPLCGKPSSLF
jgi:hypothetical protein